MSYWVYLEDENGDSVTVPFHAEGGTFAMGGIDVAELNVTYNYSRHYGKHLDKDSLRWLHGKKASDTSKRLLAAVEALGTERSDDYWEPTEGNAGFALAILYQWSLHQPDAVWRVS